MAIAIYMGGNLVSSAVSSINLAENLTVEMRDTIADIHSTPPQGRINLFSNGVSIGAFNSIDFRGDGVTAVNDGNYSAVVTGIPGFPVGTVLDYAGMILPRYWLWCDGSEIDRTVFSALYAAIGVTYGGGNSITTFNIPDARGRVVAGRDNMTSVGAIAAGRITVDGCGLNGGSLGEAGGNQRIQSHSHVIGQLYDKAVQANSNTGFKYFSDDGVLSSVTRTTGDGQNQNIQPTIILNKIIFTGVA